LIYIDYIQYESVIHIDYILWGLVCPRTQGRCPDDSASASSSALHAGPMCKHWCICTEICTHARVYYVTMTCGINESTTGRVTPLLMKRRMETTHPQSTSTTTITQQINHHTYTIRTQYVHNMARHTYTHLLFRRGPGRCGGNTLATRR